jgi:alkylation response protein AidB-like acyl-CoA dehydrogenase
MDETQRLLHDTTARFVREHYSFEARKRVLAAPLGAAPVAWATLAELGLLGIGIDERFGGTGGGFEELAVVFEVFGRGLVVEPYLATVVLSGGLLTQLGSEQQQAATLPEVTAGRLRLALAHSEPQSRYDLAHVETTAIQRDGDFVLNGRKTMVLGGDCADTFIVAARSARGSRDVHGISLFLVDRAAPGLKVKAHANFDGTRAAELSLERLRLPGSALLGRLHEAHAAIERIHDRAIAALGSEAVGAMAALNELTLDYLKTRRQFGRPIGDFQVLQHRMVDMTMAQEQAAAMAALAARAADSGDPGERAKAISAAKVQIGKSAQAIGRGAIQLHGGIGLTDEYVASHYFKRLTAIDLMFGDVDHHLARFAALSA